MHHALHFRSWAAALAALALLASSAYGGYTAAAEEPGRKPNVIFISIDDLNNWIGPLRGHPQARTPNIDRFAQRAVNFARTYTASPSCNPSRTALLSGKPAYRSGMYSNYQDWRDVMPDEVMLPGHFRDAGYWTGGAGKIYHNNQPDLESWMEYFPSIQKPMPSYHRPNPGGTVNMPVFEDMYMAFDWAPLDVPMEETGDYSSVRWAIDKLNSLPQDEPFFLGVGIYRPHNPWYVPREYFDMFPYDEVQLPPVLENDLDDIPERGREIAHRGGNYHKHILASGNWRSVVQAYLASMAYADDLFGILLDAIDESPHADSSILVMFSDHGWSYGQKEHWRKFALWENVLHTPLMIEVPPGVSPALPEGSVRGGRVERITSLLDIFPTLTDLAGLASKPEATGNSLVPLLADPLHPWDYPAISTYDFGEFSVRSGRYHYIHYIDGSEEFYDLADDPLEWHNRAADPHYAEAKARLAAMIPDDPAPLGPLIELQPHHIPPFASPEQYRAYKAEQQSRTP